MTRLASAWSASASSMIQRADETLGRSRATPTHDDVVAEFAHQSVGRPLEGATVDERRDGDDVVTAAREHLTHAADPKNRVDRDERIRRRDHDALTSLEGARVTSSVARARSRAHDVDGAAPPTSWWWRTKYSWKLRRPSSVSNCVAIASSRDR